MTKTIFMFVSLLYWKGMISSIDVKVAECGSVYVSPVRAPGAVVFC